MSTTCTNEDARLVAVTRESARIAPATPDEAILGVLDQPSACAQLGPEFVGFMHVYEAAARVVPHDMTVVDIGASTAIQGWWFADHAGYVACDLPHTSEWDLDFTVLPKGSATYEMDGRDFVREVLPTVRRPFVIVSAVPCDELLDLVATSCPDCLVWYPGHPAYAHGYGRGAGDALTGTIA